MNKQGKRTGQDAKLRTEGGAVLQNLRKARGLTQRELAEKLDLKYYTMISQIEAGSARIPPNLFIKYAKALDIDEVLFVRKVMEYYDPFTYIALFGNDKLSINDLVGIK